MPCEIHNPSPEIVSLPAPLRGALRGGQSIVVSPAVAAIAAAIGNAPLMLREVHYSVSEGEADDWYLGSMLHGFGTSDLGDAIVTPAKLSGPVGDSATTAALLGNVVILRREIAAGVTAEADDVVVCASLPVGLLLVDVILKVDTAGAGGSTATLRLAAGGEGLAISSDLSTAATGIVRTTLTDSIVVDPGGTIYLRRTDDTMAGRVDIIAIRTTNPT